MRLYKWSDIDRVKIQKNNIEREISASSIHVLKTLESIFEGSNKHVQAYQCDQCGNLFMIGEDKLDTVPDDGKGGKLCPTCVGQEDPNQDKVLRWKRLAKLTDAIDAWKMFPNDENFIKIKELAKGFFDFNSVQEMYAGYHKFSEEVNQENPDLGVRLDKSHGKTIDELFDKIKEDNTEEFVKFIFGVNHEEEKEIQETINMLEASTVRAELEYWLPKIHDQIVLPIGVKTKRELDRLRFKLLLLQYGQLVEFGFIYDVMFNLAILAKGKKFIPQPFPPDRDGNPVYPHDKIRLISSENADLGKILQSYFVNTLRNAIAHTKYHVDDNSVYKTDKKNWKLSRIQVENKRTLARAVFRHLLNRLAKEQAFLLGGRELILKNGDKISLKFN